MKCSLASRINSMKQMLRLLPDYRGEKFNINFGDKIYTYIRTVVVVVVYFLL